MLTGKSVDRKSGSAGMPRPISYAVFCLKKKLSGAINVRLAREGEKFLALDGKTYALTPENLVIADDERAVGIAGVMGGEESGVTESTRNVLLESAYFLPASIRRMARELNLPSDASYRFERGVDPEMILPAVSRAEAVI